MDKTKAKEQRNSYKRNRAIDWMMIELLEQKLCSVEPDPLRQFTAQPSPPRQRALARAASALPLAHSAPHPTRSLSASRG